MEDEKAATKPENIKKKESELAKTNEKSILFSMIVVFIVFELHVLFIIV